MGGSGLRLLTNDVSPSERDGHAGEKDAGSANSSAISATEDVLSRRTARSDGRGFVLQQLVRLDLHNHTTFSSDGLLSPHELLSAAAVQGVSCLAVTDHDSVRGGLEAAALAESDPFLPRVIPGAEVSTQAGELIGLYLRKDIPARLPVFEAISRIRAQGGLVYLPHPHDRPRRGAIDPRVRDAVAAQSDIIEVVNGRSLGPWCSRKALELARRAGKPAGAGSDAHRAMEVGMAYVLVDALPTWETLVALLEQGRVEHKLGRIKYGLNWASQSLSPLTRIRRRLSGGAPPHPVDL